MIALDTNILVYAHTRGIDQGPAAREAIVGASNGVSRWGIAFPVIAEFFRTVTRKKGRSRTSTPQRASRFLEELLASGMLVWRPREGTALSLMAQLGDMDVTGTRVFDLQIALIALENGAHEIWTHDHDFVRLAGLKVIDPLR